MRPAVCARFAAILIAMLSCSSTVLAAGPVSPPAGQATGEPIAKEAQTAEGVAYKLQGVGQNRAGRWFIKLPGELPSVQGKCRPGYSCGFVKIRVPINHPEMLAGHVTRLTLSWSAEQKGVSELEVLLAANDEQQLDWLRPSASGDVQRRLTLEIPAPAVRRREGLEIELLIATRTRGKGAVAKYFLDGLELELLP